MNTMRDIEQVVEYSGGSRISRDSEVGAPTLQGMPTYDFAKISQKLHKIKRIWTPGGASLAPPLDPPLEWILPRYAEQRVK